MIQSLAKSKISCGIFFAPVVPDNARQFVNYFKDMGINLNFICVLTQEQKKLFLPYADENVVELKEFQTLTAAPKFIFVLERYFGTAFMNYFQSCGTKMFFLPYVDDTEALYNLYMKHLPKLFEVHEMLADEESKKVFRAAITGRITRLMQDFVYTDEHEYFLGDFLPKPGEIAIDGGSYDGDTSADFARQGAKVYAFEMDTANYKNCLARAKKEASEDGYVFTIENLGLSNQESEAFYSSRGMGSRKISDNNGIVGKFIDLDTYVERKNLPRVDYIKLDIEGSELDALQGAAKTISRWKPKMAICVYHKPEDLWTLPLYIKHLRPDYEFRFRHHPCDRKKEVVDVSSWKLLKYFDVSYRTPSEYDMILYCK